MKFLASLPEAKHYTPLRSTREGVFLWEDKASPIIRVRAPEPNPWGKDWVVMPSIQQNKNDTAQYPERLIFKCFYPEEAFSRVKIIRALHRAKFCHFYTDQLPGLIGMYTIPVKDTWWLIYSIIN